MSKRCIGYNDITKEYIYYDEEGNVINSQKELEKDAETGLHTINDIWWKITKDFRDKNDVKDKQIADLEAKLAESENKVKGFVELFNKKQHENYEQFCEIQQLKQQLAEKTLTIEQINKAFIENRSLWKGKYERANQDKISFCVEQLEKVKEKEICGVLDTSNGFWDFTLKNGDAYILDDALLDLLEQEFAYQIEELKKEKHNG